MYLKLQKLVITVIKVQTGKEKTVCKALDEDIKLS